MHACLSGQDCLSVKSRPAWPTDRDWLTLQTWTALAVPACWHCSLLFTVTALADLL